MFFAEIVVEQKNGHGDTWHDWLVFMTGLIFSKDSHFIT